MLTEEPTIDLDSDTAFQSARAYVASYLARNPVLKQPSRPASAPVGLVADVSANGPWLISSYGEHLALGFKGNADFIERCFSWAVNTQVIGLGAQLNWFYGRDGRLAYICPKSEDVILAGLRLQFRAEIIAAREVPPLEDHTADDEWAGSDEERIVYNEAEIDALAGRRAAAFMADYVIRDSFVLDKLTQIAPTYELGYLRAESGE